MNDTNNNMKPVIFLSDKRQYYRQDNYVQNILLKALSQGITDPKELKKLAGLSKVADVYRSLDKLAIRKEYHNALVENGVDLNFLVSKLKGLVTTSKSDVVKLASLQTFLKSIGLEKYEKQEDTGKGWEEAILAISGSENNKNEDEVIKADYEVKTPIVPESELLRQKREKAQGKDLYEDSGT